VGGAGAASIGYYDETVLGSPAGDLLVELAALEGQPVRAVRAPEGIAAIAIGDTIYQADLRAPYAVRRTSR
jgi:hypothetical protein